LVLNGFRIPILDFPTCVIGDGPDLSLDNIEIGEFPLCSWRNVYSCINLLRVLNKITKWKHSRIMVAKVQYFAHMNLNLTFFVYVLDVGYI